MPVSVNKWIVILLFTTIASSLFSQDNVSYKLETFGSLATGSTTPFWITTNTYGLVPLDANNGYLRGQTIGNYKINKNFNFNMGVDLVGSANHTSAFFIQQLYGEISFQSLFLTIGQKEYYNSMLNRELSSGDFNYSTNAHPNPEIRLSIPEFTNVPFTNGFLQVRGDFSIGKSTDNNYILDAVTPGQDYTIDILWHHKSIFLQVEDPKKRFPLGLTLGLEHAAQWGGWTTWENVGNIPHSFSDFIRIVLCEGGGEDATLGDQANVLGNHQGTYNARLSYKTKQFELSAYKQHFFDDASGVEYANWRDGILGLECVLHNQNYLKNVVLEYINTTDQSGPMHFLNTDKEDARGGGNDDYYNHDYYLSGWSYWGRTLGNPLITSPEYNKDGVLSLKNNRIKALHIGLKGDINEHFGYRIFATGMYAWGRMTYPFLKKKKDFSTMVECNYTLPKSQGWKLSLQLAVDRGNLYDQSWGCAVKVSKTGSFAYLQRK